MHLMAKDLNFNLQEDGRRRGSGNLLPTRGSPHSSLDSILNYKERDFFLLPLSTSCILLPLLPLKFLEMWSGDPFSQCKMEKPAKRSMKRPITSEVVKDLPAEILTLLFQNLSS